MGQLFFLTWGGVLIGLAMGGLVAWFERWVDDGPIEIVISILVPCAASCFAKRSHISTESVRKIANQLESSEN